MAEASDFGGALPTFGADVAPSTGESDFRPRFAGEAGTAVEKAWGGFTDQLNQWGQQAATDEAQRAGKIAGTDPGYRPDDSESVRGIAFRTAAVGAFGNQLEATTRQAVSDIYTNYMAQPPAQRDPAQLVKSYADLNTDYEKNHVFPEVAGAWRTAFTGLTSTYMRAAQQDLDKRTQDQARASLIQNTQSAADTAHRVAALGTPDADATLGTLISQHDKLIDQQVANEVIDAQQAVKMKAEFAQSVRQAAVMGRFNALPDDQKPGFAESFQRSYGAGVGLGAINEVYRGPLNAAAPGMPSPAALYDHLIAKGASRNEALLLTSAAASESGLNPNVTHDGGKGFGLWGHNGDRLAAMDAAGGRSWQAQADFALNELRSRPEAAMVDAAKSPEDLVVAEMHYEQPQGYTAGAPQAGHNYTGRLNTLRRFSALGGGTEAPQSGNPTAGLSPESYAYLAGQMQSGLRGVASQANQVEKGQLADIAATQKQIEGGFDIPDTAFGQMAQTYGASPSQNVAGAFATLGAIRSMLSGFKGQPPEAIEAQIATAESGLAKEGADPRQVAIVKAAQGYLTKYRADVAADPLGRAAKDGMISGLAALPRDAGTLAAAIPGRIATADQAAVALNRPTPAYFTPDEKANLKQVSAAGGPAMIATAKALAQGFGPRLNDALKEIGGEAPQLAGLAQVAAWGGSPGFLDDMAEAQRLKHDPAAKGALDIPPVNKAEPVYRSEVGDALRAIPALGASVESNARDVFGLRAFRDGLDKGVLTSDSDAAFRKAVQERLGATYIGQTQYGGIGSYKTGFWSSSQKILAPLDMQADSVGTAIGALRDDDVKGAVYGDGATPVPARVIQGGHLVSVGHGQYQVALGDPASAEPRYVGTPNGQRYVLDLNALAPALRQRVPAIYKGAP